MWRKFYEPAKCNRPFKCLSQIWTMQQNMYTDAGRSFQTDKQIDLRQDMERGGQMGEMGEGRVRGVEER